MFNQEVPVIVPFRYCYLQYKLTDYSKDYFIKKFIILLLRIDKRKFKDF